MTTTDLFDGAHLGGNAKAQLISLIERVEKLAAEKKAIGDDIKEIFAESKASGFDVTVMRKIVAIRKMDREKYEAQQQVLDTYLAACGLL